jgi:hypothetical protein
MSNWLPLLNDGAIRLWASIMLIAVFFLIARVAHANQRTALLIALLVAMMPVAVLPALA